MNYTFNTGDKKINTWISFESYNDSVSIYNEEGKEVAVAKLHNNTEGDLVFDHNGLEIPFRTFECVSMAEIKRMIEAGERVFESEFAQAIIHDGMHNVRFGVDMPVPDMIFPGTSIAIVGDKTQKCACKLVEEYLNMPHDKYKLKVEAVDENAARVCRDRYYMSDFLSLIKSGHIDILDSVDDGKTSMEHIMEYFHSVTDKDYFDYKMPACLISSDGDAK